MYDLVIWNNYFEVGQTAFASGHLDLAESMHRAAYDEALKGVSSACQAMSSYSLGLVMLRQGKTGEGQKHLRKAVSFGRESAVNSAFLVGACCALADSYLKENSVERAVPLLKLTLRRIAHRDGGVSPNMVPVLKRLVFIYNEKNFSALAGKYLRRLMEIQNCPSL